MFLVSIYWVWPAADYISNYSKVHMSLLTCRLQASAVVILTNRLGKCTMYICIRNRTLLIEQFDLNILSLTHWLTHSLTHWLTHWLTDWLTHSLTHSLAHFLRRSLAYPDLKKHNHREISSPAVIKFIEDRIVLFEFRKNSPLWERHLWQRASAWCSCLNFLVTSWPPLLL